MFLPVKFSDDCEMLQDSLNYFSAWCFNNEMLLNVRKCSCITFSKKKKILLFITNRRISKSRLTAWIPLLMFNTAKKKNIEIKQRKYTFKINGERKVQLHFNVHNTSTLSETSIARDLG